MNEILAPLTAAQREAVTHVEGPLLILAGPGSGKTRVVTHRLVYLLRQAVPARQLLALTFTNKAADEMRQRVERLAPGESVWIGTFHRFCASLLRRHAGLVGLAENFSIYDADDSRKVLGQALANADLDLTHITPDQIGREISRIKTSLISPAEYTPRSGSTLGPVVEQVYPRYQQQLLSANAVDFDDMLLHVALLLRDNPELRRSLDERYRYVLVDEYQDTNFAQYAIIRALCRDHPNLAVTGDPDQSIYGWRGADIKNILDFERDYPQVTVVRLEQNFRSTKYILQAADQLISYNTRRKPKALYTDNAAGRPVRLVTYPTAQDEAEHIATRIADDVAQGRCRPSDCAVFYRVNSLSRVFEQAFRNAGVPYQIVRGLEFYQRREVKDILAYLHLINNPRNDVALRRIINLPPRQIGARTVQHLADYAAENQLCLLDAAREAGLIKSLNKRSATHVAKFVAMFDRLSLAATDPVGDILEDVLTATGYHEWLEASELPEDEERLANVKELLTDGREFDMQQPGGGQLEEFLERTSLVSDTDAWEFESDRVSLMTLHAAKGLEFPTVYIVALEEGLVPHQRSQEDPQQLEEERRLLFVGITRARGELQLSNAQKRVVQGNTRWRVSSSFLMELPREEMEVFGPRARRQLSPDTVLATDDDWTHDPAFQEEAFHEEPTVWQADLAGDTERQVSPSAPPRTRVKTAAEMLAGAAMDSTAADGSEAPAIPVNPDVFQPGMVVRDPSRGLGKIISVSGKGEKRSATVQFVESSRQRTFYLIHSRLEPVRSAQ